MTDWAEIEDEQKWEDEEELCPFTGLSCFNPTDRELEQCFACEVNLPPKEGSK